MYLTGLEEKEDAVRIELVAKKQNEYRLVGRVTRRPGHRLFEYDKTTGTVVEAQCSVKVALGDDGKPVKRTITQVHANCIYLQALNLKNARRILIKFGIL